MNKVVRIILAVLALIGVSMAIGKVFVWGDSVVNYGSYVPWGLWVSFYVFLVGAAAGSAWLGFWLGFKNDAVEWQKIGFSSAAVALIGALGFIGLDLGKPLKGIMIFFSPSFSSPLAWASWGYALFILAVLFFLFKGQNSAKSPFGYLALGASVLFLLAEARFFSGMIARDAWYSWTTVVTFITSAVVAGGAMIYMAASFVKTGLLTKQGDALKKTLIYAIVVHIVVELGHLVMAGTKGMSQLSDWKFWVLFVGIGGLVAVLLLLKGSNAFLGSIAALAGIIAYKYGFVSSAFKQPAMDGLPQAFQHTRLSMNYAPTLEEWVIAIGLICLVILVISWVIPKTLSGQLGTIVKPNNSAKA